ncbi:MAG: hypothetical protein WBE18_08625 [Gammaproteobacteria bacterium]
MLSAEIEQKIKSENYQDAITDIQQLLATTDPKNEPIIIEGYLKLAGCLLIQNPETQVIKAAIERAIQAAQTVKVHSDLAEDFFTLGKLFEEHVKGRKVLSKFPNIPSELYQVARRLCKSEAKITIIKYDLAIVCYDGSFYNYIVAYDKPNESVWQEIEGFSKSLEFDATLRKLLEDQINHR